MFYLISFILLNQSIIGVVVITKIERGHIGKTDRIFSTFFTGVCLYCVSLFKSIQLEKRKTQKYAFFNKKKKSNFITFIMNNINTHQAYRFPTNFFISSVKLAGIFTPIFIFSDKPNNYACLCFVLSAPLCRFPVLECVCVPFEIWRHRVNGCLPVSTCGGRIGHSLLAW